MFSVLHEGKVLDVVCRKHPASKTEETFRNWYVVYVGEKFLGQAILSSRGGWTAICDTNPEHNWMAKGYSSRRHAIEYMLRCAGYWKKD